MVKNVVEWGNPKNDPANQPRKNPALPNPRQEGILADRPRFGGFDKNEVEGGVSKVNFNPIVLGYSITVFDLIKTTIISGGLGIIFGNFLYWIIPKEEQ